MGGFQMLRLLPIFLTLILVAQVGCGYRNSFGQKQNALPEDLALVPDPVVAVPVPQPSAPDTPPANPTPTPREVPQVYSPTNPPPLEGGCFYRSCHECLYSLGSGTDAPPYPGLITDPPENLTYCKDKSASNGKKHGTCYVVSEAQSNGIRCEKIADPWRRDHCIRVSTGEEVLKDQDERYNKCVD
jgi:hypothetical protein